MAEYNLTRAWTMVSVLIFPLFLLYWIGFLIIYITVKCDEFIKNISFGEEEDTRDNCTEIHRPEIEYCQWGGCEDVGYKVPVVEGTDYCEKHQRDGDITKEPDFTTKKVGDNCTEISKKKTENEYRTTFLELQDYCQVMNCNIKPKKGEPFCFLHYLKRCPNCYEINAKSSSIKSSSFCEGHQGNVKG